MKDINSKVVSKKKHSLMFGFGQKKLTQLGKIEEESNES